MLIVINIYKMDHSRPTKRKCYHYTKYNYSIYHENKMELFSNLQSIHFYWFFLFYERNDYLLLNDLFEVISIWKKKWVYIPKNYSSIGIVQHRLHRTPKYEALNGVRIILCWQYDENYAYILTVARYRKGIHVHEDRLDLTTNSEDSIWCNNKIFRSYRGNYIIWTMCG